ncbi:MAG: hypothetical protein J7463_10210 [Roseiflexus sp.]|nr:hypothetical protein [Roseiflexus sp.]MBO9336021.1 hypothetical protein [Roseiflexus sp.]MBO9365552.1 hypothetical protein [Roseiflexus sp.]MBO9381665.1 hypothetical protein [Roseiflexus sp.]MBO9388923.1 hypothetical protein [Roseiflexus sp.]
MPTIWLQYGGSRSISMCQETPGTTVESDDSVPGALRFDRSNNGPSITRRSK